MFNASADRTAAHAGIEPGIEALIDTLQGSAGPDSARFGVRIRLPGGMSSRRPAVLAMAFAPVRDFAEARGARLFALRTGDVFLLLAAKDLTELEPPLKRLLDPVNRTEGRDVGSLALNRLTETWDLSHSEQRLALANLLRRLRDQAPSEADGDGFSSQQAPLGADLAKLSRRITPALVASCVQRRTVLAIRSAAQMSGLFEDYRPDTAAIQQTLGCDLLGDPLPSAADELGRKIRLGVVEALLDGLLETRDLPICVHLPLSDTSSLLAAEILKQASRGQVIIDISLPDALAAFDRFELVRNRAQRSGNRIVLSIEGIGDAAFVDLEALQTDFIRFRRQFGSALVDGDRSLWPATIARLGGERLIVGDVDDEQRLQRGMELGIRHFSGLYIERLAAKLRQKGALHERAS